MTWCALAIVLCYAPTCFLFEAFGAWVGVVTTNVAVVWVNAIFSKPTCTVPKVRVEFSAWLKCSAWIARPSGCHALVNYV